MISKRWVESYLRFLLRNQVAVSSVIAVMTCFFAWQCQYIKILPQFLDFYPGPLKLSLFGKEVTVREGHPYIKIYNDFRRMFGSANILTLIIEKQQGDIYNPETLQMIDEATKYVVETKGVIPYQIMSIAHAKMKSLTTVNGGISIREVYYPGVPKTAEDAARVKFAVYANKGIRGLYVSEDDTAALVNAGFWEEELDFEYLRHRMLDLKAKLEAEHPGHTIYITGFPWLYASVLEYVPQVGKVFVITTFALTFLLWNYFRSWPGVWVPIFSGILSSIWALGMVPLLGLNLDPLVLVIPVFLSARALSHSVQSMDRYHEEYHRTGDKMTAIIESYSHLFPPAIASVVSDGIGILLVSIAPIPLIQKCALFSSFWIASIIVSVVTLHPIILSATNPPGVKGNFPAWSKYLGWGILGVIGVVFSIYSLRIAYDLLGPPKMALMLGIALVLFLWHEKIYQVTTDLTIAASNGNWKYVGVALTIALYLICPYYGWRLKVGDMTPGAALLFADHPYNTAYAKLNEKFLGASQLVIIADTGAPDGLKDVGPLTAMEEFADHMEAVEGAGASVTVIDIVKQMERLFHEGEPKWAFVPDKKKFIAEIFYQLTQTGSASDLDRFISQDQRYGTIITLFRSYSHTTIMNAINQGKEWAAQHSTEAGNTKFLFAGGLFGVLAAVNEAVDDSYWLTLAMVMIAVSLCLYFTYGSLVATLLLMIPVILSQLACEAFMWIYRIDLNVNSLPIAAAGAGVGVDYGIYHFSRMIDCVDEGRELDDAIDYATATTGKAIIFTATTMLAGTIFWWFSDLKFQAEMGLLLALLMVFNTFGGLVLVPAWMKVVRPRFLTERKRPEPAHALPARAAVG